MKNKKTNHKPEYEASTSARLSQEIEFEPQTEITLIDAHDSGEDDGYVCKAIVIAHKNKHLIVTEPSLHMTKNPTVAGHTLVAHYYDGKHVLAFDAAIVKRVTRDNTSYLLLDITGEIKSIQRRENFRLKKLMDGKIQSIMRDLLLDVIIKDVSAGGASIQSPEPFVVGDNIEVYLPLGNNDEMVHFNSVVKRCVSNVNEDGGKILFSFNIGVQFIFESNKEQEALFARIAKMQLEQIRNRVH